jgi:hypothetical protein
MADCGNGANIWRNWAGKLSALTKVEAQNSAGSAGKLTVTFGVFADKEPTSRIL